MGVNTITAKDFLKRHFNLDDEKFYDIVDIDKVAEMMEDCHKAKLAEFTTSFAKDLVIALAKDMKELNAKTANYLTPK